MYYIKLHKNQKLHRYMRITIWMLFAAYVINLLMSFIMAKYMGGMVTNPMAMRENMGLFLISGLISFITGLASLVFPVLFLVWIYRAYDNLKKINPALTNHAVGWAVGGWFVPFLNFIRPYQITTEIWNKTQRAMRNDGEQYNHEPQTLVNLWWGATMVGAAIYTIGFFYMMSNMMNNVMKNLSSMRGGYQRFQPQEMMEDTMNTSLMINGFATLFYLAALVILSIILKKLAPIEEGLAERVDRNGFGQWGTQQQQQYSGQNY